MFEHLTPFHISVLKVHSRLIASILTYRNAKILTDEHSGQFCIVNHRLLCAFFRSATWFPRNAK